MGKKLFITGTGTDVGKTYITALLMKKLVESGFNAAYYKAAMSGNELGQDGMLIPGDALQVKTVSGTKQNLDEMCPYVYREAYSPHLAAHIVNRPVDMKIIEAGFDKLKEGYDYITMEGSGGIICPLRVDAHKNIFLEHVIKMLDIPCVIVADAGLGTINNTVLTDYYMKSKGIRTKGVIYNNYSKGNTRHEDNVAMCEKLTGLKTLTCVGVGDRELNMKTEEVLSLYV